MGCTFCELTLLRSSSTVILEDSVVICIPDNRPIVRGHILLIPKRHVQNVFDLPEREYRHVMYILRTISNGVSLAYNPKMVAVFVAGYQIQEHGHIHILPLNEGLADTLSNTPLRDRDEWAKESLRAEALKVIAALSTSYKGGV